MKEMFSKTGIINSPLRNKSPLRNNSPLRVSPNKNNELSPSRNFFSAQSYSNKSTYLNREYPTKGKNFVEYSPSSSFNNKKHFYSDYLQNYNPYSSSLKNENFEDNFEKKQREMRKMQVINRINELNTKMSPNKNLASQSKNFPIESPNRYYSNFENIETKNSTTTSRFI